MRTINPEALTLSIGDGEEIGADLFVPDAAIGLVVFAHGSGSSRFSTRNRAVAESLHAGGFGTLLADLLTRQEESVDAFTAEFRFDIPRLGRRMVAITDWLQQQQRLAALPVGYFGASTGAAAAVIAASQRPAIARAVVSRGGRPDLAHGALPLVKSPTLLIVGGHDEPVIEMNEEAMNQMTAAHVELTIVPGATHLFEEPGTLEQVQTLAAEWFARYLPG
jgi:putative phosphoribosyl transferase